MATWYRIETSVAGYPSPFVDWYRTDTSAEALEIAGEEAHRYGLPAHKTTITWREATPAEAGLFETDSPSH